MSTASRSSGFSPISARRRVNSRTLSPASIRMRVFDVARNAEFPALPLASTQNFTMTILPRSVLSVRETRHNGPGKEKVMGLYYCRCLRCRHLRVDHVDKFLDGPGTFVQRSGFLRRE